MADGTKVQDHEAGVGHLIATDPITDGGDLNGQRAQMFKLGMGADGEWVAISEFNPLQVHVPDRGCDAFGRIRVSNPHTVFDSKQIFDNAPLFWDESLESGSGITSSHSTARASTTITSTLNTNGLFTRQTFRRFNYEPGKSQLVFMTGILGASGGGTGVFRCMGMYDDDNGLFFQDREGVVNAVVRSSTSGSPVDTRVSQANWNRDKLDGTGASGINLAADKGQIAVIDFEWLSIGRVRFGFMFDGMIVYCHEFLHANILGSAYMSTPNLPLRYQMETTGGVNAVSSLEAICATVLSEGGTNSTGVVCRRSTQERTVDCNVVGTVYGVLGLRLKSTHLGLSIKLLGSSIGETAGSKNYEWLLLHNPTVADGSATLSWTSVGSSSGLEYTEVDQNSPSTNTVTGGFEIGGDYAASSTKGGGDNSDIDSALTLGAAIDGTRDELWLCVRPLTTNGDYAGSLIWRELS